MYDYASDSEKFNSNPIVKSVIVAKTKSPESINYDVLVLGRYGLQLYKDLHITSFLADHVFEKYITDSNLIKIGPEAYKTIESEYVEFFTQCKENYSLKHVILVEPCPERWLLLTDDFLKVIKDTAKSVGLTTAHFAMGVTPTISSECAYYLKKYFIAEKAS